LLCGLPNTLNRNTFAATDKLSRQLMCIVRCQWPVYSSFSTCNSAIHHHHRTQPAGTSAKLNHPRGWHSGKNWPGSERVNHKFIICKEKFL